MRVLWIKMGGLWPLNTGGRQRTFQLVAALSKQHDVVFVTTHGDGDDPETLKQKLEGCEVISLPHPVPKYGGPGFARALVRSWLSRYPVGMEKWRVPAVRALVRARLADERFDVVVADFVFAMPQVPDTAGVPLVFFPHNVEYVIWHRLAGLEPRWIRRLLLAVEWRKMRRCELAAVGRADLSIAVSEGDRATFAAARPAAPIDVIPTGVDTTYFAPIPNREVPRRLVFSGSMDWYPNEDAILYFVRDIWPRLRSIHPDLTMTVVGRNPSPGLSQVATAAGITITGTVDDVRGYIAEASVYVVPLRIGGGTRLKIFEAMAMGKAVVSTTIGAEGLAIEPHRDLLIADGSLAFASAVLQLFGDDDRRRAIAAAGHRLVCQRYSWPAVAREFEDSLVHAVKIGRAPSPTDAGRAGAAHAKALSR